MYIVQYVCMSVCMNIYLASLNPQNNAYSILMDLIVVCNGLVACTILNPEVVIQILDRVER